jgi:hypothetical protein
MLDKEIVDLNYEATLYALSLGVELQRCIEVQLEAAEENEFSIAEGMRLATLTWLNKSEFNCKVRLTEYDDTTEY